MFTHFGKFVRFLTESKCKRSLCVRAAVLFPAEIPGFSARNRIFLRFLCIAKRVTGHGVNSNLFRLFLDPDMGTFLQFRKERVIVKKIL